MIPFFAYNSYIRIFAMLSLVVIVIKHFQKGNKKVYLLTLLFIIITFIINYISSDKAYIIRHLQLYVFLSLIYLSTIVLYLSIEKKKNIILIILIFNLIALIGTYFGLLIDGHASRALSKSGDGAIDLTEQGIGGYGTIYSNVVLIPVLFYLKTKIISSRFKIIIWLNIIIAIIVIIKANYLIAVLLIILQFLAFLFTRTKGINKVFLFVSVFFGILFIVSNVDYIENATRELVEGTTYAIKHRDFFNQLNGQESEYGSISSRAERYQRSFKMIFINPITGVLSYDDIGKHSNILDQLAQYGIVFFSLFIYLLINLPMQIMKREIEKKHIIIFITTLLLLGLLNNYPLHIGIAYILLASSFNLGFKKIEI
tara:strand:+ start:3924 stop:5033 length:1110 start_codon:yes stop_codon:yes gene_type:complete